MTPRSTRSVIAVAALATTLAACAADPPSAVVGIDARGCRPFPERGSGTFVEVEGASGPLVLTSAHVVAGAQEITVHRDAASAPGRVVAFDPDMDLAYLAVDGLRGDHPLTIADATIDGAEPGTAYVVRDGEVAPLPVTVVRSVTIRTEDVYVEGETLRPGLELTGDIVEGDSGGAVTVGGSVVGVVWARSRIDAERAYAIDLRAAGGMVRDQLETGDLSAVDLTRCP